MTNATRWQIGRKTFELIEDCIDAILREGSQIDNFSLSYFFENVRRLEPEYVRQRGLAANPIQKTGETDSALASMLSS